MSRINYKEAYLSACKQIQDQEREIAELAATLPSTFYADRPLKTRLQFLVDGWQRAIEINKTLEQENLDLLLK